MINVLVVSIQASGGGAETVLKNLQAAVTATATPIRFTAVNKHAFDAESTASRFGKYLAFVRHVRSMARQSDFVMSGLEGMPFFVCMAAVIGLSKPLLVLWLHCTPRSYVKFQTFKSRMVILGSIALARRIICAAPLEAARLASKGKHTLYLPNLRSGGSAPIVSSGTVTSSLIFIGSLARLKQPHKCIDVLAKLRATVPSVNFELTIFGTGPLFNALRQQSGDAGVADATTFNGFVDKPWQQIAANSIVLVPSLTEAMPMVVLEAFQHGCVVIANRFDGASFFEAHDGLFLIADFDDTASVTAAIERLRRWSAAELARRIERSSEFIETQFDSEKSLAALYSYLVQSLGHTKEVHP